MQPPKNTTNSQLCLTNSSLNLRHFWNFLVKLSWQQKLRSWDLFDAPCLILVVRRILEKKRANKTDACLCIMPSCKCGFGPSEDGSPRRGFLSSWGDLNAQLNVWTAWTNKRIDALGGIELGTSGNSDSFCLRPIYAMYFFFTSDAQQVCRLNRIGIGNKRKKLAWVRFSRRKVAFPMSYRWRWCSSTINFFL